MRNMNFSLSFHECNALSKSYYNPISVKENTRIVFSSYPIYVKENLPFQLLKDLALLIVAEKCMQSRKAN